MINITLKEIAQRLGKNSSQIARETGINRNTINALMHNKVDGIKFETIDVLCESYGIDLKDLLERIGNTTAFLPSDHVYTGPLYRQEGEFVPLTGLPPLMVWGKYVFQEGTHLYKLGHVKAFFEKNYGFLYLDQNSLQQLATHLYSFLSHRPS